MERIECPSAAEFIGIDSFYWSSLTLGVSILVQFFSRVLSHPVAVTYP